MKPLQLNPLKWFSKKDYDLSDPLLAAIFGNGSTLSGVSVGPDSALKVPAVSAAVQVISESVAASPLHLYTRKGDTKERDTGNPLYSLVHDRPNPWTSSFDLRQQIQTDALLNVGGYAFVNRVGGEVKEILRISPSSVSVKIDPSSGEPAYEVTETGGGKRTLSENSRIAQRASTSLPRLASTTRP